MPQDQTKIRFQIDLEHAVAERLEWLRRETGAATKKELFNIALSLVHWAVEENRRGRQIGSRGPSPMDFTRLMMPTLDLSPTPTDEARAPIIRTLNELSEYIGSELNYLESDDGFDQVLGRFLEIYPIELERAAQVQRRNRLGILRDTLLTVILGFDVMDVSELRRRQLVEPQHSVTVLARNFLDRDELYDVVVSNLLRGIQYTYWQRNPENFLELAAALSSDDRVREGQVDLPKLLSCILGPSLVFVTDVLIYDAGHETARGYINKLMEGRTVQLLPMDQEHLLFLSRNLNEIHQGLVNSDRNMLKLDDYEFRLLHAAA